MKLFSLLKDLPYLDISAKDDEEIQCLSIDSKTKIDRGVYFCIKGIKADGHDFAAEAVANGATCLVVTKYLPLDVAQVLVSDVRKCMSLMALRFYDIDFTRLRLVGVTGTNGKTTTTTMIYELLKRLNDRVALIGTNGIRYDDNIIDTNMTTPDTILLCATLAKLQKLNIKYVIMEISAHAIDLDKLYGFVFVSKCLTNITQDHLDYFNTMQKYISCKMSFLDNLDNTDSKKIINIDDMNISKHLLKYNGETVYETISNKIPATYRLYKILCRKTRTTARLAFHNKTYKIRSNMIGEYNIYNLTMAISVVFGLGYDLAAVVKLSNKTSYYIEGRSNVLSCKGRLVVVDYAHTPDGIKSVINAYKALKHTRLTCIIGCGGDRDRLKRPLMLSTACTYADNVVITSDNPRYESPQQIINDATEGIKYSNYTQIIDRATAIKQSIKHSKRGEIILLCGKGAENYMDIMGHKTPYSDIEEVYRALSDIK